jgi:acyl carrier protein
VWPVRKPHLKSPSIQVRLADSPHPHKRTMTPADIRNEVLDILSDIAPDEDLSTLNDDVPFREQLELDSMDFLDIVMELRKRHRVQIPEEDYKELVSMASTVAYLTPKMKDL